MRIPDLVIDAPAGVTLAAALRVHLPGRSWNDVRKLCTTGKVTVGGTVVSDPAVRLAGGERIEVTVAARRLVSAGPVGFSLVFEDAHLVVIEKPAGVTSVPFERGDTGTALDLVRGAWRRQGRKATASPLYVVHRLDKETSGLICFAKTRTAERGLHRIFQHHLGDREYLACAHGRVESARIESLLIPDRGDGMRGSARREAAARGEGQRSVTHVTAVEQLPKSTLCRVRLETGRTHQIRIHLAERGHPIVGDPVYVRDWLRAGRKPIAAERMMLHAATLGFEHPVSGERVAWTAAMPEDFAAELEKLRR